MIEQKLMNARENVTTLKFDGSLEATVGSSTEIGKERFLTLLGQRVEENGQETFCYAKNSNNEVVSIIEDSHNFITYMVISEFEISSNPDNTDYVAFDSSFLSCGGFTTYFKLLRAIVIGYGHLPEFKLYPWSVLLMMGFETCNVSVSYDIDGATESFYVLTLDNYPG
jgi:hypothetical protein